MASDLPREAMLCLEEICDNHDKPAAEWPVRCTCSYNGSIGDLHLVNSLCFIHLLYPDWCWFGGFPDHHLVLCAVLISLLSCAWLSLIDSCLCPLVAMFLSYLRWLVSFADMCLSQYHRFRVLLVGKERLYTDLAELRKARLVYLSWSYMCWFSALLELQQPRALPVLAIALTTNYC